MKQITILSDTQHDLITLVTQLLADAAVDIDSISGECHGRQAIVTVTVRNDSEALKTIQAHPALQVISEEALLVRVEDELGALAKLSRRFSDAGIEIRSIRFIERHQGYALVAIATARTDEALKLVENIIVT